MYLNFLFCIPDDGHIVGPKYVWVYCMYKLILVYVFAIDICEAKAWNHACVAFIGAIVVYKYGDVSR
jgi:hypothetical protein